VGYLALRLARYLGRTCTLIMDVESRDGRDDVLQLLLSQAIYVARTRSSNMIAALPAGSEPFERALRQRRFLRIPSIVPVKRIHFACRPLQEHLEVDLRAPRWRIGLGDMDIF
jgi:hypothetical protein